VSRMRTGEVEGERGCASGRRERRERRAGDLGDTGECGLRAVQVGEVGALWERVTVGVAEGGGGLRRKM